MTVPKLVLSFIVKMSAYFLSVCHGVLFVMI